MQYRGSCHCGKVKIQFEGTFDKAISCNCSICAKRGSLLWFAPRDSVQVTGESELRRALADLFLHRIVHLAELCRHAIEVRGEVSDFVAGRN